MRPRHSRLVMLPGAPDAARSAGAERRPKECEHSPPVLDGALREAAGMRRVRELPELRLRPPGVRTLERPLERLGADEQQRPGRGQAVDEAEKRRRSLLTAD